MRALFTLVTVTFVNTLPGWALSRGLTVVWASAGQADWWEKWRGVKYSQWVRRQIETAAISHLTPRECGNNNTAINSLLARAFEWFNYILKKKTSRLFQECRPLTHSHAHWQRWDPPLSGTCPDGRVSVAISGPLGEWGGWGRAKNNRRIGLNFGTFDF